MSTASVFLFYVKKCAYGANWYQNQPDMGDNGTPSEYVRICTPEWSINVHSFNPPGNYAIRKEGMNVLISSYE
jgi:hypothetical protein